MSKVHTQTSVVVTAPLSATSFRTDDRLNAAAEELTGMQDLLVTEDEEDKSMLCI